jgi:hypothetical protein
VPGHLRDGLLAQMELIVGDRGQRYCSPGISKLNTVERRTHSASRAAGDRSSFPSDREPD